VDYFSDNKDNSKIGVIHAPDDKVYQKISTKHIVLSANS